MFWQAQPIQAKQNQRVNKGKSRCTNAKEKNSLAKCTKRKNDDDDNDNDSSLGENNILFVQSTNDNYGIHQSKHHQFVRIYKNTHVYTHIHTSASIHTSESNFVFGDDDSGG